MTKTLILSSNLDWRKDLTNELRSHENNLVSVAKNRSDAISTLTSNDQDLFIIDDTYSLKDVEMLLKYLSIHKNKLIIFFISQNFEIFKDVLKLLHAFNLNLVSAPISAKEMMIKIMQKTTIPNKRESIDSSTRMNAYFLKIFTDATKKILKEFCGIQELQFQKPRLTKLNESLLPYAIRGKIELDSNQFQGSYYIHFDERTYLKIVNSLLMTEDLEINDDNKDFAGEIVNMIYGQAKIDLNQAGYNFDKNFPTYEVMPNPIKTTIPTVQVMITTNLGEIEVLIMIKKMDGFIT